MNSVCGGRIVYSSGFWTHIELLVRSLIKIQVEGKERLGWVSKPLSLNVGKIR